MGLFNKLKNVLFEEEEIEIEPEYEEKEEFKEEPFKEKKEKVEPTNNELENDHDLYKVENTFNFPDFDEDEFAINYEIPKEKEKPKEKEVKPLPKENVYEYEEKIKIKKENPSRHERIIKTAEISKKAFKPSPIISPVYGVLDKNYTKDDIVTVEKSVKVKTNNIDVDMVRKKAFGTLEEDLEKTLSEPVQEFFGKDSKSIDELLNESIDDTLEIKYSTNDEYPKVDEKDNINDIEEELDKVNEDVKETQSIEKPKIKKEENPDLNNTLENDLFDLIDSMYDNKENE